MKCNYYVPSVHAPQKSKCENVFVALQKGNIETAAMLETVFEVDSINTELECTGWPDSFCPNQRGLSMQLCTKTVKPLYSGQNFNKHLQFRVVLISHAKKI